MKKPVVYSMILSIILSSIAIAEEPTVQSVSVEVSEESPVKNFTFVEEKTKNSEGEDIVRSIEFTMINDNPFLNLIPGFTTEDDYGYTHGVSLAYSYLNRKTKRLWEVDFNTALYTEQATPEGRDEQDYYDETFPDVPQRFNEVSHLSFQTSNIYERIGKKKNYYVVGIGVGLMNDKNDDGFLAAGQQQAWHDYKHNNLTPESTAMYANIPGNTEKIFGSANVAVGRVVTFNDDMENCGCEINRIKVEYGAEVFTIQEGSNIYFLMEYNQRVANIARVNLYIDVKNQVTWHGDFENETFFGVSARYKNLTISTGMSYRMGEQNHDFFKYQDDDAIWTLKVKYKF